MTCSTVVIVGIVKMVVVVAIVGHVTLVKSA